MRFLVSGPGVDSSLHFINGAIDDAHGPDAVAALIVHGDFELMARRPQVIQRIVHVRLAGLSVLNENAAGSHDSEGEGEEEVSDVEFHTVNLKPKSDVASKITLATSRSFFVTFRRKNGKLAFVMAVLFANYYPFVIALVFLGCLYTVDVPEKGAFFARAMVALIIATFLAHVNRIFDLWPAHLLFPSGHTTFCFGVALSLGMLRPWTLAITLPLVVVLGVSMVSLHYHTTWDILGAIPLVLVVYGVVHWCWRLPSESAHFDQATVSS